MVSWYYVTGRFQLNLPARPTPWHAPLGISYLVKLSCPEKGSGIDKE